MTKPLMSHTFYAGRKGEPMRCGPFPSRQDAIEEAPRRLRLQRGERFEVGRMLPVRAFMTKNAVMQELQADALRMAGVKEAEAWRERMDNQDTQDLMTALGIVVDGWLTRNDLWPAFGGIVELTEHQSDADHTAPVHPCGDACLGSACGCEFGEQIRAEIEGGHNGNSR